MGRCHGVSQTVQLPGRDLGLSLDVSCQQTSGMLKLETKSRKVCNSSSAVFAEDSLQAAGGRCSFFQSFKWIAGEVAPASFRGHPCAGYGSAIQAFEAAGGVQRDSALCDKSDRIHIRLVAEFVNFKLFGLTKPA